MPSLLRSLLSEHLDPGYAAAAASASAGARPQRAGWPPASWQVLAALLVATVFAVAVAQARSTAPGVARAQQVLAGSVRSAEAAPTNSRPPAATRWPPRSTPNDAAASRATSAAGGCSAASTTPNLSAAATAVIGPGLTVTVTDPGVSKDLSDVSKERVEGSRQVILDRDLQLVVNSLWASGAEAISVGGVRIGPNVTIRQAGGGILVDNQPISSPYVILAVGPPTRHAAMCSTAAPVCSGCGCWRPPTASGSPSARPTALTVPAGSVRDVNFAKQIGP